VDGERPRVPVSTMGQTGRLPPTTTGRELKMSTPKTGLTYETKSILLESRTGFRLFGRNDE